MNNNTDKIEDLLSRTRFKSLPFNETEMYELLNERIDKPFIITYFQKDNNRWKYLFVAASLALLIVSSIQLIGNGPEQTLVYYETTAVPDAKTKIVLPDSSVVWLNANACLRYPREFSAQQREVEINGEAFFEIRKDENKPFIVQSDGINIRVLGTSFNVVAPKSSDIVEVTLVNGCIALFKEFNRSEIADKILHPGQRALFHKFSNKMEVSDIRTENSISWVTRKFIFKENTLEEISVELERAFHVKIHIENEAMKKHTFNADFTDNETLDEILSILQIVARYKIEKRKGEIFLK